MRTIFHEVNDIDSDHHLLSLAKDREFVVGWHTVVWMDKSAPAAKKRQTVVRTNGGLERDPALLPLLTVDAVPGISL